MTPIAWNADREILTPGFARTQISGGWRNYIKRGYVWQSISALVAGDLSCTTFPGNVQFAADSQGWSEICIDGTFSMARHIAERNGHNAEPELRLSIAVECDHNVAGHIDTLDPDPDKWRPWQVVYPGAWDCADLRLGIWQGKAARIEKVIDFHSMPDGDQEFVEHSFLIRSSHARVLAGPNFDTSPWDGRHSELFDAQAFVARADSQLRGVLLKTPVAWYYTPDGTEVRTPIRVTFEIQDDGETVRCTKHIPRALIATALANGSHLKADATLSPDGHPEAAGFDAVAKGSGGTWAATIGSSGSYSDDSGSSGSIIAEATASSGIYGQYRHAIYVIDSSSIGSGQQVDSLSFTSRMDNQRLTGTMGLSTNLYASTPAGTTGVINGDYMAVGSTPFTDTPRLMSGESFDNPWVTQTMNAAGRAAVDVTGYTKLALGIVEAHESGSPTWASNHSAIIALAMAESGANAPYITVTHSAASSFGAWYAQGNQ